MVMQTYVPFERLLVIKRYSPATTKIYGDLRTSFQAFVGELPLQDLDIPALLNQVVRVVESK